MKTTTIQKQAGFTLIELIMVIVILGVLSAFALPRFADLGGEARTASINALTGSLKSASNIAHAQFLAQGSTGTVTLEGNTITMVNGYPSGAAAGIDNALDVSDYTAADGGGTPASRVYSLQTNCQVEYTESAAANSAPTIVATTSGC